MTKAVAVWAQLNDRQRAYLRTRYRLDQAAEERERGVFAAGGLTRPAEQWRWITHGCLNVRPTRLPPDQCCRGVPVAGPAGDNDPDLPLACDEGQPR